MTGAALGSAGLGVSLPGTVGVLIWAGDASLGFWGGVAVWGAGPGGWGIALGAVCGPSIGGAVLLLEVFLQPGQAVSNGVAGIAAGHRLGA
ncbi:MAG: hypothetical protein ACLP50_10455 [Solirubrobacteraceae bacterium]